MKLIKKANIVAPALNTQYKAGDRIRVVRTAFDGRTTQEYHEDFEIVKINRTTLDVTNHTGNVWRMNVDEPLRIEKL